MANIPIETITKNNDGNTYVIKDANAIPKSGGTVLEGTEYSRTVNNSKLILSGGTSGTNGGSVEFYGKDHTSLAGYVSLKAQNSSNYSQMIIQPSGTFTFNNNGTTKNLAMQEDVVPRSGGAVLTGKVFSRADANGELMFYSGYSWYNGGYIEMYGNNSSSGLGKGTVIIGASLSQDVHQTMFLQPNGTWTWSGTACQITSDQRLKQQISEIDNALLDAWEDVEPVQFKYNDAVDKKGDNARLHTGYVVQQIDSACKSHGVDISEYGLYCHEEYHEETEEIEVEQKDGTKTKERKVIREASEHYSLRYTEALIVECAYLRKCIKELKEEIKELKNK